MWIPAPDADTQQYQSYTMINALTINVDSNNRVQTHALLHAHTPQKQNQPAG